VAWQTLPLQHQRLDEASTAAAAARATAAATAAATATAAAAPPPAVSAEERPEPAVAAQLGVSAENAGLAASGRLDIPRRAAGAGRAQTSWAAPSLAHSAAICDPSYDAFGLIWL
jgi:hypothetical protein